MVKEYTQRLTFPFLDFARLGAMKGRHVNIIFPPRYGNILSDSLSPTPIDSRDHFTNNINEDCRNTGFYVQSWALSQHLVAGMW